MTGQEPRFGGAPEGLSANHRTARLTLVRLIYHERNDASIWRAADDYAA